MPTRYKIASEELVNSTSKNNLIKNGNFINNSTNGYGGTPDDFTSTNANAVQGGFPSFTKQQLIDLLGIADGDIEGLWNLKETSGNATDLSTNAYNLVDTNTVLSSDDGLMGKARDFEKGSAEYFVNANTPNLGINGNKTVFFFIKYESNTGNDTLFNITATNGRFDALISGGKIYMRADITSLTTLIGSDVVLEAGKWYAICIVYSSNGVSSLWINGIKKSASNGTFDLFSGTVTTYIGFDGGADYFDGLMQNFGVLSIALTDSQVKKLWAYTTYKGQKIRRATSDGNLYQTLDEALVERLRGKTVTMRATMWQDIASIGQININDGIDNKSLTTTTTGSWVTVSKTVTISATATAITLKLEANTSDGNVWFKEVAFYEGSGVAPYSHSQDDQNRFPRLLKLDPPQMYEGKPYQYEENRKYSFVTTPTWTAGTAPSGSPTKHEVWSYSGNLATVSIFNYGYTAGATVTKVFATLPIISTANYQAAAGSISNGATPNLTRAQIEISTASAQLVCSSVSADRLYLFSVYQID